ncbi:hypothetical protein EBR96_02125, partial [bacterium]|nr:hypothetical protein [bacterium]
MSDISLGKRRQSKFGRKAIWTVLLLGIVLAFGYWLTRETPSPTDSSTTRLQSFTLSPKPQRTTRPVLVDSHNGTIIFPIEFPTERSHYDPEFVNIAIFDKTEQTSKYLFPKNGSIRWFAARRAANNGTIAIIASTEDTNSDGRIDDEDIHQLYWLNPRTMGLTKLDTPLLNFAERVPVALEFRAADDVSL